jgi:magnesium-transporting ATPase (P-type)
VRTVAQLCGLDPEAVAGLEAQAEAEARLGHRTLAVAAGADGGQPGLLGLVHLFDPPRPDAEGLIARLRNLGVAVKMLTGDALAVAQETARSVGLDPPRRVPDLKVQAAAGTSDPWAGAGGFAELYPEDKFEVVRHLQGAGQVAGMTGDGVNDAPALRQAEVGIAVSSATDVAKSAASVVLTEPGLANIVTLVQEGRTIYQRVLTWILNKISRTILKGGFVTIAFLATGRFAVTAFAMLLLTLVTDFGKISLATDRVRPSPRPESWAVGGHVAVAAAVGLLMVVEALAGLAFAWTRLGLGADPVGCSTFSFLLLLYFAPSSILSLRERRWCLASRPSGTLLAALVAELVLGTALTRVGLSRFSPLPWGWMLGLLGYALVVCLVVNDAVKTALIRLLGEPSRSRG